MGKPKGPRPPSSMPGNFRAQGESRTAQKYMNKTLRMFAYQKPEIFMEFQETHKRRGVDGKDEFTDQVVRINYSSYILVKEKERLDLMVQNLGPNPKVPDHPLLGDIPTNMPTIATILCHAVFEGSDTRPAQVKFYNLIIEKGDTTIEDMKAWFEEAWRRKKIQEADQMGLSDFEDELEDESQLPDVTREFKRQNPIIWRKFRKAYRLQRETGVKTKPEVLEEFDDQRKLNSCRGHWNSFEAMMKRSEMEKIYDELDKEYPDDERLPEVEDPDFLKVKTPEMSPWNLRMIQEVFRINGELKYSQWGKDFLYQKMGIPKNDLTKWRDSLKTIKRGGQKVKKPGAWARKRALEALQQNDQQEASEMDSSDNDDSQLARRMKKKLKRNCRKERQDPKEHNRPRPSKRRQASEDHDNQPGTSGFDDLDADSRRRTPSRNQETPRNRKTREIRQRRQDSEELDDYDQPGTSGTQPLGLDVEEDRNTPRVVKRRRQDPEETSDSDDAMHSPATRRRRMDSEDQHDEPGTSYDFPQASPNYDDYDFDPVTPQRVVNRHGSSTSGIGSMENEIVQNLEQPGTSGTSGTRALQPVDYPDYDDVPQTSQNYEIHPVTPQREPMEPANQDNHDCENTSVVKKSMRTKKNEKKERIRSYMRKFTTRFTLKSRSKKIIGNGKPKSFWKQTDGSEQAIAEQVEDPEQQGTSGTGDGDVEEDQDTHEDEVINEDNLEQVANSPEPVESHLMVVEQVADPNEPGTSERGAMDYQNQLETKNATTDHSEEPGNLLANLSGSPEPLEMDPVPTSYQVVNPGETETNGLAPLDHQNNIGAEKMDEDHQQDQVNPPVVLPDSAKSLEMDPVPAFQQVVDPDQPGTSAIEPLDHKNQREEEKMDEDHPKDQVNQPANLSGSSKPVEPHQVPAFQQVVNPDEAETSGIVHLDHQNQREEEKMDQDHPQDQVNPSVVLPDSSKPLEMDPVTSPQIMEPAEPEISERELKNDRNQVEMVDATLIHPKNQVDSLANLPGSSKPVESHQVLASQQVANPDEPGTSGRKLIDDQNRVKLEEMDQDHPENLVEPQQSAEEILQKFVEVEENRELAPVFQKLYDLFHSNEARNFFKEAIELRQWIANYFEESGKPEDLAKLPELNFAFRDFTGFFSRAMEQKPPCAEDLEPKVKLEWQFQGLVFKRWKLVLEKEHSRQFFKGIEEVFGSLRTKQKRTVSKWFGFNYFVFKLPQYQLQPIVPESNVTSNANQVETPVVALKEQEGNEEKVSNDINSLNLPGKPEDDSMIQEKEERPENGLEANQVLEDHSESIVSKSRKDEESGVTTGDHQHLSGEPEDEQTITEKEEASKIPQVIVNEPLNSTEAPETPPSNQGEQQDIQEEEEDPENDQEANRIEEIRSVSNGPEEVEEENPDDAVENDQGNEEDVQGDDNSQNPPEEQEQEQIIQQEEENPEDRSEVNQSLEGRSAFNGLEDVEEDHESDDEGDPESYETPNSPKAPEGSSSDPHENQTLSENPEDQQVIQEEEGNPETESAVNDPDDVDDPEDAMDDDQGNREEDSEDNIDVDPFEEPQDEQMVQEEEDSPISDSPEDEDSNVASESHESDDEEAPRQFQNRRRENRRQILDRERSTSSEDIHKEAKKQAWRLRGINFRAPIIKNDAFDMLKSYLISGEAGTFFQRIWNSVKHLKEQISNRHKLSLAIYNTTGFSMRAIHKKPPKTWKPDRAVNSGNVNVELMVLGILRRLLSSEFAKKFYQKVLVRINAVKLENPKDSTQKILSLGLNVEKIRELAGLPLENVDTSDDGTRPSSTEASGSSQQSPKVGCLDDTIAEVIGLGRQSLGDVASTSGSTSAQQFEDPSTSCEASQIPQSTSNSSTSSSPTILAWKQAEEEAAPAPQTTHNPWLDELSSL